MNSPIELPVILSTRNVIDIQHINDELWGYFESVPVECFGGVEIWDGKIGDTSGGDNEGTRGKVRSAVGRDETVVVRSVHHDL